MNAPPPPKNNPDISTERRLAGVIDNRPECLQKKNTKEKKNKSTPRNLRKETRNLKRNGQKPERIPTMKHNTNYGTHVPVL
jgi:hypothetical protein